MSVNFMAGRFECAVVKVHGSDDELYTLQEVEDAVRPAINRPKLVALVSRWRNDAATYQKQVDEARRVGTPHAQMLSAATFLRQCANDLEALIDQPKAKE